VEVGANQQATTTHEDFKQLVRDITLQIAAASPVAISRNEVAVELVEKEKEIASQSDAVKGKPAQAVAKIIEGKLNKFFEGTCLLEQGFVKNPDLKVLAHVGAVSKQLGDEITVRRFVRFQVGEPI
jgi:elongation factor Ts